MKDLNALVNETFPGLVVRKDLVKLVKGNAVVPSYVLEYLLGQYCASNDEETIKAGIENVKEIRVFFRMRKRHLLPALHDGMQGDEDGMQTCERPPLWAFGWPRGGVHMFTSLHVACLARVA